MLMSSVLLYSATDFEQERRQPWSTEASWSEDESHSFRSPQKVSRLIPQVGLLAWREATELAEPLHLPRSFDRVAMKRQPSLTVAGPRRFHTGLPFYALSGT